MDWNSTLTLTNAAHDFFKRLQKRSTYLPYSFSLSWFIVGGVVQICATNSPFNSYLNLTPLFFEKPISDNVIDSFLIRLMSEICDQALKNIKVYGIWSNETKDWIRRADNNQPVISPDKFYMQSILHIHGWGQQPNYEVKEYVV